MGLSGTSIIGHGDNRNEMDFYPTPSEVTFALLKNVSWPKHLTVWEPACGENKMVDVLKTHFMNVIGTDIITGYDFLSCQLKDVDACVTNPPFKLSVEFIKRATIYPYAAMLLKSTYWHSAKRTKLFYDRRPSKILCLNWRPQFDPRVKKSSPTMDFIWSVWEPNETKTEFIVCSKPTVFEREKHGENAAQ